MRNGFKKNLLKDKKFHLLSPCLFNLYAEPIMRNARLDELQAGIKIGGRMTTTSDMRIPL